MEPMPFRLLRRELGWNCQQKTDYKKQLCSLHCRGEDQISLSIEATDGVEAWQEMNPIYHLEFCPMNHWLEIVASADEKGFLTLVNTRENVKNKVITKHRCHDNALLSSSWSPHKLGLIATGSADQSVKLWDASNEFQMVREFKAHTRTVKTVKFHPSHAGVFVSSGRDGSIMIWDSRTNHDSPENVITSAHYLHNAQPNSHHKKKPAADEVSVTDVLYKDDNTLISCGATDGFIKFWDLRKTYKYLKKKDPVRKIPYPQKDTTCVGYTALCLDELNNLYVASACTEIFKFNLSTESDVPESCFNNNANMQFYVKMDVSSDGRYLVAGSMNSFAHVWDTYVESDIPFTYLEGQTLDCTLGCAVFSRHDPLTLVTGADDSSIKIWRVNNMKSRYKKCGGLTGGDNLPKAPLDSIRMKQQQSLQSIIPCYGRPQSQVSQVVGTWTSSTNKPLPRTSSSSTFNLCSLLSDLPNFVIDGRMCHLPEKTQAAAAVSRKHTWLGNIVAQEREKEKRPASSNPNLKETPPKRLKSRNSNSVSSPGNYSTPPRKTTPRQTSKTGSGTKRKHAESPTNFGNSNTSSILKYFTVPVRTSTLTTSEY